MLLKPTYSKRQQFLLKLTLSIYLIFACERVLGATLFIKLDNLVPNLVSSDFQFDITAFLEQERQNWGDIAEKILVAKADASSSLGLLVASTVDDRDRNDTRKTPLSIRSVVETFKQLDLETDRKNAKPSKVPVLPQVAYSDIDKGVYVFETTAKAKERSTNVVMFDPNNFASAASLGKVGSIGISGFSVATPNSVTFPGTTSLPQASGAVGMTSSQMSAPNLNAQFSLLPQNKISTSIGSTNASVNNVLNALNSFGGLKVDVGFRLFPSISVRGELDLRDDAFQKSELVSSNLAMTSPLQSQIKAQIERNAQESSEKQRGIQRSMYAQAASGKPQYKQIQIETSRKIQEQQKRQIERQQARRAKIKDKFDKQIKERLQRYKERREKL